MKENDRRDQHETEMDMDFGDPLCGGTAYCRRCIRSEELRHFPLRRAGEGI